MKYRIALYGGVFTACLLSTASYAQLSPAPTVLEGGSVLVYGLDGRPSAAALMPTQPGIPSSQPSVVTVPVAVAVDQSVMVQPINPAPLNMIAAPQPVAPAPVMVPPSETLMDSVGVPDTSYHPSGFYIAGSNSSPTSSAVPAMTEIAAPMAPHTKMQPILDDGSGVVVETPSVAVPVNKAEEVLANARAQAQSKSLPPVTEEAPASVMNVPAPTPVETVVAAEAPVSMPPAAPAPVPAYQPMSVNAGDNCAINESLMQKITLLEKEKETLRTQMPVSGPMQDIAQCAAETSRIQALEARLSYLQEENESLKRIAHERATAVSAVPLPEQVAPDNTIPKEVPQEEVTP